MRLAALIAILLAGCGYGFVRSDGGPVATLQMGAVHDLSAEGDLGVLAARALQRRFVERVARSGPTLTGELRTLDETVVAHDGSGAMYRVGVRLELQLVDDGGAPLWSSGPTTRHEVYVRGRSPFDSREARRHALVRATEAAVDEAAARFLHTPSAT